MSRPWVRCGSGTVRSSRPGGGSLCAARARVSRGSRPGVPTPRGRRGQKGARGVRRRVGAAPQHGSRPRRDRTSGVGRRQRGGDAALAAEGAHPAHRADRRRRGPRHGDPDRVRRRRRQQQQQRTTSTAKAQTSGGTPATGIFKPAKKLQVRLRQPRDDEPVLRPDALRRRGRLQAAGLQLPVDGLGELERQRDGQRVQHRHHRRRGRHRGRASSTPRRSTARPTRR